MPLSSPAGEREGGLLGQVRHALRKPQPWDLLALVSGMLTLADPRMRDPFARKADSHGHELLASFTEVARPETSALLAVLTEMISDAERAGRLRQELARRGHPLPAWLGGLGPLRVEAVLETTHVLGDATQMLVGVQSPSGHAFTTVVLIDHNAGDAVTDGFVVWEPVESVGAAMRGAIGADPDTNMRPLDPADARARVTEAIARGAMAYPPYESETWPTCRPMVEWVLRYLPEGGSDSVRPEWDDEDRLRLAEAFFASPFGAGCDDQDRDLFDSILWFACDYGPGDPLRWSPTSVEILLGDWLPRKVVADAEHLARAPDLLRRFIRYSHAERAIRAELTAETLAIIDELEPEYQKVIRTRRPQGAEALLAAMGVLDEAEWSFDEAKYLESRLDGLRETVGGAHALEVLDFDALPDEPFDWQVVPDAVRARVEEVLALAENCCQALFDAETRIAARRMLADIVARDASIFQRRGRVDTAAAALMWLVAHANGRFSLYGMGLTVKELLAWFGLTGSVAQRAGPMLHALRPHSGFHGDPQRPGTTRYLTSVRRRALAAQRDDLLTQLARLREH